MTRIGKLTLRDADWRRPGPLEVPHLWEPRSAGDWAACFGREADLAVEIGPGKGEFLLEMARRHPERNWLAVEIKRLRLVWIEEKVLREELENVRLMGADALRALPVLAHPGGLAAIHVNFPDPWPRLRQSHKRLGQSLLANAAAQLLRVGGRLHFVTDREDRAEEALAAFEGHPALVNVHGPGGVADELEDYPATVHERKFRAQGRGIRFLCFSRRAGGRGEA